MYNYSQYIQAMNMNAAIILIRLQNVINLTFTRPHVDLDKDSLSSSFQNLCQSIFMHEKWIIMDFPLTKEYYNKPKLQRKDSLLIIILIQGNDGLTYHGNMTQDELRFSIILQSYYILQNYRLFLFKLMRLACTFYTMNQRLLKVFSSLIILFSPKRNCLGILPLILQLQIFLMAI